MLYADVVVVWAGMDTFYGDVETANYDFIGIPCSCRTRMASGHTDYTRRVVHYTFFVVECRHCRSNDLVRVRRRSPDQRRNTRINKQHRLWQ